MENNYQENPENKIMMDRIYEGLYAYRSDAGLDENKLRTLIKNAYNQHKANVMKWMEKIPPIENRDNEAFFDELANACHCSILMEVYSANKYNTLERARAQKNIESLPDDLKKIFSEILNKICDNSNTQWGVLMEEFINKLSTLEEPQLTILMENLKRLYSETFEYHVFNTAQRAVTDRVRVDLKEIISRNHVPPEDILDLGNPNRVASAFNSIYYIAPVDSEDGHKQRNAQKIPQQ